MSIYLRVALILIPIIFSVVISVYFYLKAEKTALLYSFLAFQVIILIMSTGQILEELFYYTKFRWPIRLYEFTGVCFIGFGWFLFCLFFTENKLTKSRICLFLLAIPSIVFYILLFTNPLHHLFFSVKYAFGILSQVNIVVCYIYLIAGLTILIRYMRCQNSSSSVYSRKQSVLIFTAAAIPAFLNMLYVFTYLFQFHKQKQNFTPTSFIISFIIIVFAISKYRFLNIVPIAIKKIVDNTKEAIIVVNIFNRVVEYNHAFSDYFGIYPIKSTENIVQVFTALKMNYQFQIMDSQLEKAILHGSPFETEGEIAAPFPVETHYRVNVRQIRNNKNAILGRVVSFYNITEYKNLLTELSVKNIELKKYADTIEELAITRERNRFASDVHDILGHSLTLLVKKLQVYKVSLTNDPNITSEKELEECIRIAKEGLNEVRRSVSGIIPKQLESTELIQAVEGLIDAYRLSGINIEFFADSFNTLKPNNLKFTNTIYRLCQEALTNSLRHGKAKNISILFKLDANYFKAYIFDDGCGCKNIHKGFGLNGMEQRMKDLNGEVKIFSDGKNGFSIQVKIPLEVIYTND